MKIGSNHNRFIYLIIIDLFRDLFKRQTNANTVAKSSASSNSTLMTSQKLVANKKETCDSFNKLDSLPNIISNDDNNNNNNNSNGGSSSKVSKNFINFSFWFYLK